MLQYIIAHSLDCDFLPELTILSQTNYDFVEIKFFTQNKSNWKHNSLSEMLQIWTIFNNFNKIEHCFSFNELNQ